jgi:sugar fermentation stimulation protein A
MLLPPLIEGTLIARSKRFVANVRLKNGKPVTAHCPNTGSMLSCNMPGSPVLLSENDNPKRLHRYTWEQILCNDRWVGINTMVPNKVVFEALQQNRIPELAGYDTIRKEVHYGTNSRIDLLLLRGGEKCYVEVKNVTLVQNGIAYFPDSVTTRGTKHLVELLQAKKEGHRAIIFFFIQRVDYELFRPARHLDPEYSDTLQQVVEMGVEIMAWQANVSPVEITLGKPVPYEL